MTWNELWSLAGACKDGDPDRLFVRGSQQHLAKRVCRHCPVQTECLAYALDHKMEYGVWGGMTERERRVLLRDRPEVLSWRDLLEDARAGWESTTTGWRRAGSRWGDAAASWATAGTGGEYAVSESTGAA